MHVCRYVKRSEINVAYLPLWLSTLPFEIGVSPWTWSSGFGDTDWPMSPGILPPPPEHCGYWCYLRTWLLPWRVGSELYSWCLHRQCLTHCALAPVPLLSVTHVAFSGSFHDPPSRIIAKGGFFLCFILWWQIEHWWQWNKYQGILCRVWPVQHSHAHDGFGEAGACCETHFWDSKAFFPFNPLPTGYTWPLQCSSYYVMCA